MSDLELLSNRVRTLENRFRSFTLFAVLVGIGILTLGFMGQAPSPFPQAPLTNRPEQLPERVPGDQLAQDEVRAHQIILVDDKGKERAALVADSAGSVFLVMSDTAGMTRVSLSISNDGPALTFLDRSGRVRTILGSTTAVPSHVNDNGIAELAPPSSIVFFDSKGKLLSRTP
jgi:hypothetical protein